MKNWGFRIALLYGAFVVMILGFVIAASRQKFDLVTPDYYGAELRYESHIQAMRNADALPALPTVTLDGGAVTIAFPEALAGVNGTINMYCAQFAASDFSAKIATDAAGKQQLALAGKPNGLWRVQISWKDNGQDYFVERKVVFHN